MERRRSHSDNTRNLYIVISILLILLVGTFGYLGFKMIQDNRAEKENELIQEGITIGAESVVVDLMNQASQCAPVPVTYNNVTLTMFALECPNLAEVATAVLQQQAALQEQLQAEAEE